MSKISGYANSVSALGTDDLLDVSEKISSSPDVYESRKMTGAILAAFVQTYAKNILENNGLTMTGNQTHDLNNLVLTFQNAGFAIEGAQTITSSSAVADIFNLYDNTATLLHRFNNAYISLFGGGIPSGSEKLLINDKTKITDRLELSGTTDGFLMPRLTTAQMNAIASPTTNLLIYNTDLSGLYRYNGSAWVALSTGYGIIEIIRDSDAGIPTFYSDLQTALDNCKTSGSNNVVKLHSDIVITSEILIDSTFLFESLLIDFNGFKVTNAQADSSDCFDIALTGVATNQKISFINGYLFRTNGTSSHYSLNMSSVQTCSVTMSNMVVYCQNGEGARFNITNSTETNRLFNDLGGSVFFSEGIYNASTFFGGNFKNFNSIQSGSGNAVGLSGGKISFFYAENTSTGNGLSCGANVEASHFIAKATSGVGVETQNGRGAILSFFTAEVTSGNAIELTDDETCSNFEAYATTGRGLYVATSATSIVNGKCYNNSATKEAAYIVNAFEVSNIYSYNGGSYYSLRYAGTSTSVYNLSNVIAISEGGVAATIGASAGELMVSNSTFSSRWDNAGGHSVDIHNSTGTVLIEKCTFKVKNASANYIYSSSAKTIGYLGNISNNKATTPINANITQGESRTPDSQNNIL